MYQNRFSNTMFLDFQDVIINFELHIDWKFNKSMMMQIETSVFYVVCDISFFDFIEFQYY